MEFTGKNRFNLRLFSGLRPYVRQRERRCKLPILPPHCLMRHLSSATIIPGAPSRPVKGWKKAVFTVWFSRVRDIEKFLAAHARVKPVRRFSVPVHAVFTRAKAFFNPGKDAARENEPDAAAHHFRLRFWIHFLTTVVWMSVRAMSCASHTKCWKARIGLVLPDCPAPVCQRFRRKNNSPKK